MLDSGLQHRRPRCTSSLTRAIPKMFLSVRRMRVECLCLSIADGDPFCVQQVFLESLQASRLKQASALLQRATSTSTLWTMKILKYSASVGNTAHFDTEIVLAGSEVLESAEPSSARIDILQIPFFQLYLLHLSSTASASTQNRVFFRIAPASRICPDFRSAGVIR